LDFLFSNIAIKAGVQANVGVGAMIVIPVDNGVLGTILGPGGVLGSLLGDGKQYMLIPIYNCLFDYKNTYKLIHGIFHKIFMINSCKSS